MIPQRPSHCIELDCGETSRDLCLKHRSANWSFRQAPQNAFPKIEDRQAGLFLNRAIDKTLAQWETS